MSACRISKADSGDFRRLDPPPRLDARSAVLPPRGGPLHRLVACRDRRAMNIAVAEVPAAK